MIVKQSFETQEKAIAYAKTLVKKGELVTVTYNEFFQKFQVNVFEKGKNGILF